MKQPEAVRGGEGQWTPSRIRGVIFRCLREGREANSGTFLVRMEAGVSYPAHRHPEGEEVFVLKGSVRVGDQHLASGDYLYTPPGGAHDAASEEGCTFLVIIPAPVEFLR